MFSKLKYNGNLALRYQCKDKDKVLKVFKLSELKPPSTQYQPDVVAQIFAYTSRNELLRRWNAQECEVCGKTEGYFEVHHIRKLKDIKAGKQKWQKLMMARKRKTLVLCVGCHDLLHKGKLPAYISQGLTRIWEFSKR